MPTWLLGFLLLVFQDAFELGQRVKLLPLKLVDPPLADLVDGDGIQVVELFAASPHGDDQVGRLQNPQMLHHRLPAHREPLAQLAERLPVVLKQTVQQLAARGIG